ncbi:EcKinase, DUF1679, and/or APH domain containing protein [Asbolus verrucosus]|uniref:EcKinase, DUF1679, and/or APH domain containing protein n=1 Tax=Asbolus verrucosus TaxID=1661398 RepID=A0A482VF30_ASBVE|nr:EcKinase, DUF1679, and/or APH domain containing protein [Asbolus verrucosus]
MMKTLNISDYKVDIGGNTAKGDGYLGEITFLKVSTTRKDYNLVIKSAKKSEELRRQTPVKDAYDREIFFYRAIFPILNEFQLQKCVEKPFVNVPKCYSLSTEDTKEAIILQNLKTVGFELHDRKQPMNMDHILLVFRQYGRFHGLSLALRHRKPSVFKSMTKNLTDIMGKFIMQAQMLDVFYKEFDNLKKVLEDEGQMEALKKYDGFEKEFESILINMSDENTVPSVITHGDCWNNNFMFKYQGDDKSKPTDMRFLDFQLSRVGSPVIDLSYFLYSCADEEVLKNFDSILKVYHSSISDCLSELGCDPETAFPFKKLKEHWREYGKFGLVMCLFLLKITLCDSNEAPDLMETAEKGEDFAESFNLKIQNQDVYNKRVMDVYLHYAEKFL